MNLRSFFLISLTVLMVSGAYSQEKKLKRANKRFQNYQFIEAIHLYNELLDDGYKTPEVYRQLGDAYFFNSELKRAVVCYDELFKMQEVKDPEYFYRYAQSLKSEGRYTEADVWMMKLYELNSGDLRAANYKNQKDYLKEIEKQSGRYEVVNADFNSGLSDFAPSFYKAEIVFSSARDTGVYRDRVDEWNKEPFLDLYVVDTTKAVSHTNPIKFSGELNTLFHESTSVFTKDGNTVYFTRNNYNNGKEQTDSLGFMRLRIFRASLANDGHWVDIEDLSINADEYSVAHPALSRDEKTLYFSSDMPGTHGQSDLFKVELFEDGSLGVPENLGDVINTEGRETFPFISSEGDLYFATDGRPGLGGLDIYVTNISNLENPSAKKIYNLGKTVNSASDDFSFVINDRTAVGYYASNRPGGRGSDDIYRIKQLSPLVIDCEFEIRGYITDIETGLPLSGTELTVLNQSTGKKYILSTNDEGFYNVLAACADSFELKARKPAYEPVVLTVNKDFEAVDIAMRKIVSEDIVTGEDLAEVLELNPIYFENDSYAITMASEKELEHIIAVLNAHPELKMEVRSHTDSKGRAAYNLKLSEKRAQATVSYLVAHGIDKSRLTSKGFGETELVNECADGVKCTEPMMAANRRSEFIVVE